MKISLKIVFVLSISAILITDSMNSICAKEDKVRAKIGIQIRSDNSIKRAKSNDRLKAGDLIRIYVHPEKASHVYVVHTDLKKATLLNMVQQKIQGYTLVMPSLQEFYQVDGVSPKETFTIIVSPDNLPEALNVLGTGNASYSKWAEVEKVLLEKSKIDLSQDTKKPFSISGNVRGLAGTGDVDPFVDKLQIFSGKSILVKRYEFRVKK